MAHNRPWYKRNGGDFLMAVMHFPDNDHRWAYSAVIDTIADSDLPLVDDTRYIAGLLGLQPRRWTVVRQYLVDEKLLVLTYAGLVLGPADWLARCRSRPRIPRPMRLDVLARDDRRCVYCGATTNLTIDHIIPWSRGGITHPCNLATACGSCNMRKGNRTPDEWVR